MIRNKNEKKIDHKFQIPSNFKFCSNEQKLFLTFNVNKISRKKCLRVKLLPIENSIKLHNKLIKKYLSIWSLWAAVCIIFLRPSIMLAKGLSHCVY